MATLKADYSSGRSSEYTGWPRAESRQRFKVIIAPVENRLISLDYDGDVYLELSVKFIQDISAGDALWALTGTSTGQAMFKLGGGFPDFGGDVGTEDNGDVFGDAIVRIGKLCPNEQAMTEGCLPCLDGCTLTIDADRCAEAGDEIHSSVIRIVREDGTRFEVRCDDGEDIQPCSELDSWLSVEEESLDMTLCMGGQ